MSRSTLVLDNEQVTVHRHEIAPGGTFDRTSSGADRLWVFVRGGLLTLQPGGRVTRWREGQVIWQPRGAAAGEGGINTGDGTLEVVSVSFKAGWPHATASDATSVSPAVSYPNIPGEDLLENEAVIVQRFLVAPGQWEGVHAHHTGQLYIHIKGGQWAERTHERPARPYDEASPDGEVGWLPAIALSVGHESGNVGTTPIDLIWVTPKR